MIERRILNSWKEIANYLGRGVRTVQRWETNLGLPVHRPAGRDHSTVLAFSNELDEPNTRRKLKTDAKPTPAPKPGPLELNHAGNRPSIEVRTTTRTTRTTGSK